jgi:hypothetical protein
MAKRLPQFCLGLMVALITTVPVTGALLDAPDQGQAAILLDPRLSRSEQLLRIADAGAELVRFGAAPGALIVNITETSSPEALRAAGAWIIADPIILGGCSVSGSQTGGFS